MQKNQQTKKHNVLIVFLLLWFTPDLIGHFTPLEINEYIVDGSLRLAIICLMVEFHNSINFSRIYLKAAAKFALLVTVFGALDYFVVSLLLENHFLDLMLVMTQTLEWFFGMLIFIQLVLSIHHQGIKITRINMPKGVVGRWRP